jgi:hypothetical protein
MIKRENNSVIWNDSLNFNAILKVKSDKKVMILLGTFVFLYFSALVFLTFFVADIHSLKNYIPFIIFTIIILVFPVRYLLWNNYGEESIIINETSLSYSFNYGILKTTYKTINFENLGISFIKERAGNEVKIDEFVYEDQTFGIITFYTWDTTTNSPTIIYETTVQISYDEFLAFDDKINIYFSERAGDSFLSMN